MPEPHDEQRADYDDAPPRPGTPPPTPALTWSPRTRRRIVGVLIGLAVLAGVGLVWVYLQATEAKHRMHSVSSLKQIDLAIHNYNDTYGEVPKNTYAPDGTPLLSWRVHLLPFIEYHQLYLKFHLDEPWDGPHNRPLLGEMPVIYTRPADRGGHRGQMTYYRGFSSPGAAFERRPGDDRLRPDGSYVPFQITDFKDGLSNTILVVEAREPVEWTEPDDLDGSPGQPFPKMGGMGWRSSFQALLGDGSVRSFKLNTPEDVLRAWITHSGGETLPPDWDNP
jgi:hypothetical protein